VSIMTSAILAAGYTGIAALLKVRFGFDGRLHDMRQLWIFVATTAVGAAVIGILYVGALGLTGFLFRDSFFAVTFRFWLGDTVGVLVTAPLLMVAADVERRRRLVQSWRGPETILQFAVLLGMILLIFGSNAPQRFYLLFLPLIWIATRNGL